MTPSGERAAPVEAEREAGLGRTFLLIVVVEILTISALYWFGRHFS